MQKHMFKNQYKKQKQMMLINNVGVTVHHKKKQKTIYDLNGQA